MTKIKVVALKERLEHLLARGNGELIAFLGELHAADLAELLQNFDPQQSLAVFRALDDQRAAEVLGELPFAIQAQVVASLGKEKAGDIIERMANDDAADLLAHLTPEHQGQILGEMEAEGAADVKGLLLFDPESAGGRMTTDLITVRQEMTAQDVIDYLRGAAPEAESVYYLYVTDDVGRLTGVVSLRELIVAAPDQVMRAIMRPKVVSVGPEAVDEEVARIVAKYNLLSVPVVDGEDRLLGMVTVDDVLDVVEKIRLEELLRVVGSDAVELERKEPIQIAKARLPWLMGTLLIELLAGSVIHRFGATLSNMIVLASFMPIISAISGNVGLQSATIIVRGLGTGIYSPRNMWVPVWRELRVDLLMGFVLGTILAFVGWIWGGSLGFGLVVGIALQASMLTAGFMGTVIPALSKRFGFDPAITAGPFETAFQDVIGFAVFLGLASLLLPVLT